MPISYSNHEENRSSDLEATQPIIADQLTISDLTQKTSIPARRISKNHSSELGNLYVLLDSRNESNHLSAISNTRESPHSQLVSRDGVLTSRPRKYPDDHEKDHRDSQSNSIFKDLNNSLTKHSEDITLIAKNCDGTHYKQQPNIILPSHNDLTLDTARQGVKGSQTTQNVINFQNQEYINPLKLVQDATFSRGTTSSTCPDYSKSRNAELIKELLKQVSSYEKTAVDRDINKEVSELVGELLAHPQHIKIFVENIPSFHVDMGVLGIDLAPIFRTTLCSVLQPRFERFRAHIPQS